MENIIEDFSVPMEASRHSVRESRINENILVKDKGRVMHAEVQSCRLDRLGLKRPINQPAMTFGSLKAEDLVLSKVEVKKENPCASRLLYPKLEKTASGSSSKRKFQQFKLRQSSTALI
ncbi:unnamed protein product [Moneuplotes crassus]|uniref:Uncharacterized protein n=1 Tax=Euplotes crassus TaxID=5936 RepID=A0AAD1ULL2_EUPCR|nr:unnamed protein product [Moneuplotes crassus]